MAKGDFEYSEHILKQMAKRGIRKREVEDAVQNAQDRISHEDRVIRAVYHKNDKDLVVVYKPYGNKIKLITTFYEN